MPELPEVETSRRAVAAELEGRRLTGVQIRQPRLRWPIPAVSIGEMIGERLARIDRRGKYLLLRFESRDLILHLGMSGSLRVHRGKAPAPRPHDHVDLAFASRTLRLTDPRRFGALLAADGVGEGHALITHLGPEPLSGEFTGEWLWRTSRGRSVAVKNFIMNGRVVVGVGNIYATEALFRAGIRPTRSAGKVSRDRYDKLAAAIRVVLANAIEAGGTTLRDFTSGDGRPGYFRQSLAAYGRAGQPCERCGRTLRGSRLGQRATVWCPGCQR